MKKQKIDKKKLSLNKLQISKITFGLNSIIGGSNVNTGNGTDTIVDKTDGKTVQKTISLTIQP